MGVTQQVGTHTHTHQDIVHLGDRETTSLGTSVARPRRHSMQGLGFWEGDDRFSWLPDRSCLIGKRSGA